jgi:hypothetical protein
MLDFGPQSGQGPQGIEILSGADMFARHNAWCNDRIVLVMVLVSPVSPKHVGLWYALHAV